MQEAVKLPCAVRGWNSSKHLCRIIQLWELRLENRRAALGWLLEKLWDANRQLQARMGWALPGSEQCHTALPGHSPWQSLQQLSGVWALPRASQQCPHAFHALWKSGEGDVCVQATLGCAHLLPLTDTREMCRKSSSRKPRVDIQWLHPKPPSTTQLSLLLWKGSWNKPPPSVPSLTPPQSPGGTYRWNKLYEIFF